MKPDALCGAIAPEGCSLDRCPLSAGHAGLHGNSKVKWADPEEPKPPKVRKDWLDDVKDAADRGFRRIFVAHEVSEDEVGKLVALVKWADRIAKAIEEQKSRDSLEDLARKYQAARKIRPRRG